MSLDLGSLTLEGFLSDLADRTPTPGGGAVAAASLALAGAIGHMAVAYSQGRSSLSAFDALHKEALATLATLQSRALDLAAKDATAYAKLNALWKLPEDDPARIKGWDEAVEEAIEAPLAVMQESSATMELLQRLVEATTPMLRSDLAVSAISAESAARAAALNVNINLASVSDPSRAEKYREEAASLLARCCATAADVESSCKQD